MIKSFLHLFLILLIKVHQIKYIFYNYKYSLFVLKSLHLITIYIQFFCKKRTVSGRTQTPFIIQCLFLFLLIQGFITRFLQLTCFSLFSSCFFFGARCFAIPYHLTTNSGIFLHLGMIQRFARFCQ